MQPLAFLSCFSSECPSNVCNSPWLTVTKAFKYGYLNMLPSNMARRLFHLFKDKISIIQISDRVSLPTVSCAHCMYRISVWKTGRHLRVASWFVPWGGRLTPPGTEAGPDCGGEEGVWLQWCHPNVFCPAPSWPVQRAATSLQKTGWVTRILMERCHFCGAAWKHSWEDII